jgi:membrane protease subunit HflC
MTDPTASPPEPPPIATAAPRRSRPALWLLAAGAILFLVILLCLSVFTVDAGEYVYLTQFGRHVATFDGGDAENDAGLHFGWPWPVQSALRLDRRLQYFDLDGTELLTPDDDGKTIDKTLAVRAYVCWRIAGKDAVDPFIRRLGSAEQAKAILGQDINSRLGAFLTQMKTGDLMSVEPGRVDRKMEELRGRLLQSVRGPAERDYGITVVDVRLRRFNHPEQVRGSIFDKIRSERNMKVEFYRSQGDTKKKEIESTTEKQVRDLLAEARFKEEEIKSTADKEALALRNQAHARDPEFYVFLKKLEKLQSILGDNRTTLLLSSHRELFDLLFTPPRPGSMPPSPQLAVPTSPGPGDRKGGS